MTEYFTLPNNASTVEFNPDAAPDVLAYRHYNKDEVILGQPMKDWLKFSVCYWHTFTGAGGRDPFGNPTYDRPWEKDLQEGSIELAKKRVDVAFEFFQKLGVEYYSFHDFDVAPEGATVQESSDNVATIVKYLKQKQDETGVKLLWATQNLFSHVRYINGAMTSPDLDIFCYSATQIQRVMDLISELDGANHVFWGGREGYQSLWNTNIRQECDQMAAMFKMIVDYKERKGYKAQLLLEPKPREPVKHQYDYDAQTCIAFLRTYDLQDHFKLNIEPNHTTLAGHEATHDVIMASAFDMLGSVDANTGDPLLGWDTDLFPMSLQDTTQIMLAIIQQGGLETGGLNFDAKARRESIEPIDLIWAHVGAMDCYALALRKAAAIIENGMLESMVQTRYATWKDDSFGAKILAGKATLEECAERAEKKGEPEPKSGKQEVFEIVRNRFLYS